MARRNPSDSYYTRAQQEEARLGQRRVNLEQNFAAAYGKDEDWDIEVPNDVSDDADLQSVGSETTSAPTTNPKRPRAYTIGYNPNTNTLIVVFRDNTWWQYNNVPVDMWLGLKSSPSTGGYLRDSGLDTWPDMGPADVDALSEGVKAQISQTAELASNMQNGYTALNTTMGVVSVESFSDEDIYKDYL